MRTVWIRAASPVLVTLVCRELHAAEPVLQGFLSAEPRYFVDEPQFPEQPSAGTSYAAVLNPQFHLEWSNGDDRFTFSARIPRT